MSQSETKTMPEAVDYREWTLVFDHDEQEGFIRSKGVYVKRDRHDEHVNVIELSAYSALNEQLAALKSDLKTYEEIRVEKSQKVIELGNEIAELKAENERLKSDYAVAIGKYSREKDDQIAALVAELAEEKADKQRVLDIGVNMQRRVNDRVEDENKALKIENAEFRTALKNMILKSQKLSFFSRASDTVGAYTQSELREMIWRLYNTQCEAEAVLSKHETKPAGKEG